MARTYTKEQLATFTGGRLMSALKVDAMEAEAEAQLQATFNPQVTEDNAAPEIVNTQSEIVTAKPEDLVVEPVQDLEFFKKLAEDEKAKTPLQTQDDSHIEELKRRAQEAEELRQKLAEAEARALELETRNRVKSEDDIEFEEAFPQFAERLEKTNRTNEELTRKLSALEKVASKVESVEADLRAQKENLKITEHFLEIKSAHEDAAQFMSTGTMRDTFLAWAEKTQPSVVVAAMKNPLSMPGADHAKLIAAFKRDVMKPAKSTPKGADVAVQANSVSKIGVGESARVESGPTLSEEEMKNFSRILRSDSVRLNPAKRSALLAAYENTINLQHSKAR